jgi:DnaJ-class molecular chaperone
MSDPDIKALLSDILLQMNRLATAIERQNVLAERANKCPNCSGDGKGYDGHRCIRCGGTGVRK